MIQVPRIAVWATLVALAAAAPALADPAKSKKHKSDPRQATEGYGQSGAGGLTVDVLITPDESRLIRSYFSDHPYQPQHLPPGIAKNLARGKPLPPGIAKRYAPPDLVTRLPPRPECDWLLVGPHIALVARSSGLVIDIVADLF